MAGLGLGLGLAAKIVDLALDSDLAHLLKTRT